MKTNAIFIWLLVSSFYLAAQSDGARKEHFNTKKNVAIEGFDPVSYFDNKPSEGKPQFSYNYKGIVYHFASAANLNKFKSAPEKYEPAYGGWCAYAMGDAGEKVKIDPDTFKIIDGKLYLFYNFWGNNTLNSWNKHEGKLKSNADKNWHQIFH